MHDHTQGGEDCVYCSVKHCGAAKVKVGEALASTDPERRKLRLLDAMFELNEIETSHLARHPEMAQKVRQVRKKLEEAAFEGKPVSMSDINDLISELLKLEASEKPCPTCERVVLKVEERIAHKTEEQKVPQFIQVF